MNTLNTALELPVEVSYDCLDEDAIEITEIKYKGSEVFVKDISEIQYDSIIRDIEADLAGQKQDALEFQAESMRDDRIFNPDW